MLYCERGQEMRKEATLEQWKPLYEVATRIKERKPWGKLWDLDLIWVRNGEEEDTVFFSILGRGGDCYGIAVYEGYDALNQFMMMSMQNQLNLPVEYVMAEQRNLVCYWGNREELTDQQRKVIKELGYKYCGKNRLILSKGICFCWSLRRGKRNGDLQKNLCPLRPSNLEI